MTLLDLGRLIKKYWLLVLACALLCMLAGAAYTYLHKSSEDEISATANIVGNSQAGGVVGLAKEEGRQVEFDDGTKFGDDECEYELTVGVEAGSQTVYVTVTGPDEDECIALANRIAEAACEKAPIWYAGNQNMLAYDGHVERATMANVAEAEGPSKKYILVALLAGLFLGVCIVVVIDLVRRPVKSIEGMQDAVELPVLEKLPAPNGERLLANVRFASGKDDLQRVCVVPLGQGNLAVNVATLLSDAMLSEQKDGAATTNQPAGTAAGVQANLPEATSIASDAVRDNFFVQVCEPFSANMSAAYEARGADATIVVARQWDDSLMTLETTVAELKLAGANVVGLVFAQ